MEIGRSQGSGGQGQRHGRIDPPGKPQRGFPEVHLCKIIPDAQDQCIVYHGGPFGNGYGGRIRGSGTQFIQFDNSEIFRKISQPADHFSPVVHRQ